MAGKTFDPEKFQLTIARLKKGGHNFEIVVEPDAAILYVEQLKKDKKDAEEQVALVEVLQTEDVFADAQKGQLAPAQLLENVFETTNVEVVAQKILADGDIHLTAKYRGELKEKKERQLISLIHAYATDPKTNYPHPVARIEKVLNESKFRLDLFKPIQQQIKDAVRAINDILPIRFEQKEISVHVPAQYAQKANGILQRFGNIKKTAWDNGALAVILILPGGLEEELTTKVANATHGEAQVEVLAILK